MRRGIVPGAAAPWRARLQPMMNTTWRTAAACLAFLILIHKAEYVINAKVVGSRTHIAVWELLAVMFAAEAVFGPAGLVAAPLFYAYLKKELQAARLV